MALFGRKVGKSPFIPELSFSLSVVCQLAQYSLRNCSPRRPSLPSLQPLGITLRGITNSAEDPSVDVWRAVTLPLLRKVIGADGQLQLKIARRGAPPKVCTGDAVHLRTGSQQRDDAYFDERNASRVASGMLASPHADWTTEQCTEACLQACRAAGRCS